MASQELKHSTLVFERICAAPVERVYAAFANPEERANWGTPPETAAFIYDRVDFREGGVDAFRCGGKGNPQYRGVTNYYDIVPSKRIVSSGVVETQGRKLLISMSTTTFEAEGSSTRVVVTVQLTSLAGEDMLNGAKFGPNASLDNLVKAMRSQKDVDKAHPDAEALLEVLKGTPAEGCYLYAFDVRTPDKAYARFFNPTVGLWEDAATGTAAGPLAGCLASEGLAGEVLSIEFKALSFCHAGGYHPAGLRGIAGSYTCHAGGNPMRYRAIGPILLALSWLLGTFAATRSAVAEIRQIEFTSKEPYGTFRAGDYVIWQGKIHGDLSPDEPIPGIDKAARNDRGRVAYSSKIILIMPASPREGNGTLLLDVPNRGRAYAEAFYNSPRDETLASGSLEQGTGFLQDHGFAIAEVYWELGQGADLPSFVDADGKTRYVEGAGFAIVRDAADFLAHVAADSAGTPNPLKGAIGRTIASGKSQDGRFLKTFLLNGFNMAGARRVFDGMLVSVSGAGLLPILQTGSGPQSSADAAPTFANPDFPGVNDGPLTIGEIVGRVEARGEIPPKMLLQSSTSDYYSLRASLGRTGESGTADRPLPGNVRMYDIAGGSHVVVPRAPCTLEPGRLDWTPVSRALLLRLDSWVSRNAEPPASELMPLEPASGEPPALRAPSRFPAAVIMVPKRDSDGNALGGVRLPDIAVPTGTNGGQNQPQSFTCMLVGSFSPFATTKAERERTGDLRPSIEERYRGRDDYVNRTRLAAQDLVARGLLLPEDAAVIVQEAASSKLFASAPAP